MSIQITDVTGGFLPIRISIYILPCFSVLIRNISGPSYGTIPLRQLGFRRYFQQPFQLESESGLGRSGLEHRIRLEFRLVRSLVRRLVRSLVSPLVRWLLSGMGVSTLASPTLGTSRLGLSALGRWKRSLSQQAQPASLGRTTAWIRRRSKRHTPQRKSAQQQQWVEPPEQHPSGYRKCVTPGHQ